jgi:hypothetical protein
VAALAVLAALVSTTSPDGRVPAVVTLLLAGCALGALVVARPGTLAAAPAVAAAAAVAAVDPRTPQAWLLAVAAAAICAVVAAAVARSGSPDVADEVLQVWLVAAGVVGAAAVGVLLVGGSPAALAACLLTAAVVAARTLPFVVVDVPDEVLLDLDRLAVTAWSARDRPRGRRQSILVRPPVVADLAGRGRRLLVAASVAVALTSAAAALVLVVPAGSGTSGTAAQVLCALAGLSLLLMSRSVRATAPRAALRAAGSVAVLAVAVGTAVRLGDTALWWTAAAALLVGSGVSAGAVAVGRGWRSVRWSRAAEVAETLTVVLCLAALPLATGLFDHVRRLTS